MSIPTACINSWEDWTMLCIVLSEDPAGGLPCDDGAGIQTIKGRRMFFFYFNKLGWPGSILLAIVLT
jgi:hypothetical protein